MSDGNGDIVMIVVVMMPEPDGQFTSGDDVVHELSELGASVVLSDGESIVG